MDLIETYRSRGGYLEGHFLLASGLHSPVFLQSAAVLQYPEEALKIGQDLAELFPDPVSFVIGPAIGGVTLAFATAWAKNSRALFAEKSPRGGFLIRPGFKIEPGEPFLAVEDVVTSGASVLAALNSAQAARAVPVGIAAIFDRSSGNFRPSVPFKTLAQLDAPLYSAQACPLCAAEVPLSRV